MRHLRRSFVVAVVLAVPWSSPLGAMELAPGNLVVGYTDGLIAQFDPSADVVDGFFSGLALSGLDVGRLGELYVLDYPARVRRLSASGEPLDEFPSPASGYDAADGLAFGREGRVFLQEDATIYVLDEAGAFVDFFALPGQGNAPYGAGLAALDGGGLIAALFYWNDRDSELFELAADGSVLAQSDRIEGRILGVALDRNGDVLYATETTTPSGWAIGISITRLDRSWNATASWMVPASGNGLGGLTTVPAPEPVPWSLGAGALVSLAGTRRWSSTTQRSS